MVLGRDPRLVAGDTLLKEGPFCLPAVATPTCHSEPFGIKITGGDIPGPLAQSSCRVVAGLPRKALFEQRLRGALCPL